MESFSRPRQCSKGAQPVPKAVYRSDCHDKHDRLCCITAWLHLITSMLHFSVSVNIFPKFTHIITAACCVYCGSVCVCVTSWVVYIMCLCGVYNTCNMYYVYVAPRGTAGRILTPRCTGSVRSVSKNPPVSTARKVFVCFCVLMRSHTLDENVADWFAISSYCRPVCHIFTVVCQMGHRALLHCKALNSLLCADVPLRNYSLTHSSSAH